MKTLLISLLVSLSLISISAVSAQTTLANAPALMKSEAPATLGCCALV